jgi:hypothetical protein
MQQMEKDLPDWYTKVQPPTRTVGELLHVLQQLPTDLILQSQGMDFVQVTVCKCEDRFICLIEESRGSTTDAVDEGSGEDGGRSIPPEIPAHAELLPDLGDLASRIKRVPANATVHEFMETVGLSGWDAASTSGYHSGFSWYLNGGYCLHALFNTNEGPCIDRFGGAGLSLAGEIHWTVNPAQYGGSDLDLRGLASEYIPETRQGG